MRLAVVAKLADALRSGRSESNLLEVQVLSTAQQNMKGKKPLIIAIVGPTAIGKSDYAVQLAKKINGEIISADSRQVYTGLNIGSGKVTEREKKGIPHYMLDVANPKKVFSAHEYKKMALPIVEDIISRGKVPIIVGGTGFYIDTLLGKMSLPEVPPNPILRKQLAGKGAAELFSLLKKIDRKRAKTIDAKNPVRLIRAIEIATAIGKVPKMKIKKIPYKITWIGLRAPREMLRTKIIARTKKQLYQGMVEEVEKLHKNGLSWKRLHELGLEQRLCSDYLQGKITEGELHTMLNEKIYQYAIRQLRWFERNKEIGWQEVK